MARKPNNAVETIIGLIDRLTARERDTLFKLLARHPENKSVREVAASALKVIGMGVKALAARKKSTKLRELVNNLKALDAHAATGKAHIELEKEMLEYLRLAIEEKARYTKGTRQRSAATKERRQRVREMLQEGIVNPATIKQRLAQLDILVEFKTVQNDISIVRKLLP